MWFVRLEAGHNESGCDGRKKAKWKCSKTPRSLIEFTDKTAQKSATSGMINVNKLALSALPYVCFLGKKSQLGVAFAI